MPSYTLIELTQEGLFHPRFVTSKEHYTQSVHRSITQKRLAWYCYIPIAAPKDVHHRAKIRLLTTALSDAEKEYAHWKGVTKGLYDAIANVEEDGHN